MPIDQRNSKILITPLNNLKTKSSATKKSNSEILITPLNNIKTKASATKKSNSEIIITPITKKNNLRSPSVKRKMEFVKEIVNSPEKKSNHEENNEEQKLTKTSLTSAEKLRKWRMENAEKVKKHQERDTEAHRIRRLDAIYKTNEQNRNTIKHRERRIDDIFRKEEQSRNTSEHIERRLDESYRKEEQMRDTIAHKENRSDENYKKEEQSLNTKARVLAREDDLIKLRDNNCLKKNRKRISYIIKKLDTEMNEASIYICVCDGGLYFKRSVKKIARESIKKATVYDFIIKNCINVPKKSPDGLYYICYTCYNDAYNFEVPLLSYTNNSSLKFPIVDEAILKCNDLEILTQSPRVAFSTIREIGWDKQKGLRGNIVNVPADIPKVLTELPRNFKDLPIVELNFKRRMEYSRNYAKENIIRPQILIESMNVLIKSPLFKKLKINSTLKNYLNDIRRGTDNKTLPSGIPFVNDSDAEDITNEEISESEITEEEVESNASNKINE